MTMPIFISYYTLDTPYEIEANRLRASLEQLGLSHAIQGLACKGKWEWNCGQKSAFIQDMLTSLQQPVVWVDADSTVVKRPVLFETIDAEFAAFRRPMVRGGGVELLSGTLYFKPCRGNQLLLSDWVRNCGRFPNMWDQRLLDCSYRGLPKKHRPETLWLPQGYCKIFDRKWRETPKVEYIVHHQASRRLKKKIK